MPNIVFAGVDGTGPDSNTEYATAMATSFVNRIYHGCRASRANRFYTRGPTLLGNETGPLGYAAARFLAARHGAVGEPKLVLSGYSRGGAAAITAAQILAVQLIPVDVMILFDAVDRSVTAMAGTIPPNVRRAYHVRRSFLALSRVYFGNCGTSSVPLVTTYREESFLATHGGVGGCPWWNQSDRPASAQLSDTISEDGIPTGVTYQQDLNGSAQAWRWISGHLASEGIM